MKYFGDSKFFSVGDRLLPGIVIICVLVFLKNAWLSDDAYITFRSVEQWFAGNGLRWNAFERVQVYTSVLWFLLLSAFRLFCKNLSIISIFLSFFCCVMAGWFVRKTIHSDKLFALFLISLLASPSFYDYTTSGLENSLGYCLVAGYLYVVSQLLAGRYSRRIVLALLSCAGLAPLVRHDLAVLIWPTTTLLIYFLRNRLEIGWVIKCALFALLPLFIWTTFSLIYYGLPFPNTAYAKLNTGVDRMSLFWQGIRYFRVSAREDLAGALIVFVGSLLTLRYGGPIRILLLGVFIHFAYVIFIGGDFMRGRFLSYGILWCDVIAIWCCERAKILKAPPIFVAAVAIALLILPPYSPLMTPITGISVEKIFQRLKSDVGGIEDERNSFMRTQGMISAYLDPPPDRLIQCEFLGPCVYLDYFKNCPRVTSETQFTIAYSLLGVFGYKSGVYCKIIDNLALSDPLLAQLPVQPGSLPMPGHNWRRLPKGYFESVVTGENLIENKKIHALYERVRVITQSEKLFTRDRWIAIWELNSGELKKYADPNYQ